MDSLLVSTPIRLDDGLYQNEC